MIVSEAPPLPVIIPVQAVSRGYVPCKRLPPVAAIKANHIVPVHGTADRHSGSENLLWFGRLSKLTDRAMNGGDQIGKLIRPQPLVAHVAHKIFAVRCGLISSVFTKPPHLDILQL